MPQKSKTAAARQTVVGKTKAIRQNPKLKKLRATPVVKGAKVSTKVSMKAKAPVKATPVKATGKAKSASEMALPVEIAPKAQPQEIAVAKAALKKEKVAAKLSVVKPPKAPKPMSKARLRKLGIEVSANEAASALAAKWALLFKKADQIEAKPYSMRAEFDEKTAIVHKLLGWGYILANRNDRLEVLFKDGIKYLISNYKL